MRLLPNIRLGAERYPEKVARRLRTLNIGTWIAGATHG
jgi:adenylate cyclase